MRQLSAGILNEVMETLLLFYMRTKALLCQKKKKSRQDSSRRVRDRAPSDDPRGHLRKRLDSLCRGYRCKSLPSLSHELRKTWLNLIKSEGSCVCVRNKKKKKKTSELSSFSVQIKQPRCNMLISVIKRC